MKILILFVVLTGAYSCLLTSGCHECLSDDQCVYLVLKSHHNYCARKTDPRSNVKLVLDNDRNCQRVASAIIRKCVIYICIYVF